ncbi:hypothetical protein FP507_03755 [Chlorobium phaeovibrioides]|uniref:Uncharacterized protein n=1 Tax=Chlorobium phaeovibrioides TaxID=1094 RepID=A0A5M8IDH7_CHLPH|nr:hypothetical protein [Chlorobium phaeovibrioides]KAA6232304.1 hypothetical protein FP507_03755 [Chlorobium phaeovibrioides]
MEHWKTIFNKKDTAAGGCRLTSEKSEWLFLNNDVVLNHQLGGSYLRKSGECLFPITNSQLVIT